MNMQIHGDGTLHFDDRICVPKGDVWQEVYLKPITQRIPYIQEGRRWLKQQFWWHGIKRDCSLCSKVSGVSASEGRTSEDGWTPSTFIDSRVEVGAHHYGFRHCTAPQSKREKCSMDYSRPPHKVSSLHPIQTVTVNRVISREVSAGDGSTA